MKQAVVIGTGAGGATVAKELQGHYDVTVVESGAGFAPFTTEIARLEKWKKTGLFLDERLITLLFPQMRVRKTRERMVLVRGAGLGGTTTISAGNAIRMDQHLNQIGINLDREFEEIYREIPVSSAHQQRWHRITRRLFETCREMNLNPQPTPKLVDFSKCTSCGRCIFGCPRGAKWDSRRYLTVALENGARLLTGWKVQRILTKGGRATGVEATAGWRRRVVPADLVVLAAGGFSTPVILQNSGILCERTLFVDPVLCVAAEMQRSSHHREIQMPFVAQRQRYMLSPYFDYLSFFFNRHWTYPATDTVSMMIKLADSNVGAVTATGIDKPLTIEDEDALREGVGLCREILSRVGCDDKAMVLGTINAGHPGGTLPLTRDECESLHNSRLPHNLYVADATIFPTSLGNPPILTIVALAKKVSKICMLNL